MYLSEAQWKKEHFSPLPGEDKKAAQERIEKNHKQKLKEYNTSGYTTYLVKYQGKNVEVISLFLPVVYKNASVSTPGGALKPLLKRWSQAKASTLPSLVQIPGLDIRVPVSYASSSFKDYCQQQVKKGKLKELPKNTVNGKFVVVVNYGPTIGTLGNKWDFKELKDVEDYINQYGLAESIDINAVVILEGIHPRDAFLS